MTEAERFAVALQATIEGGTEPDGPSKLRFDFAL
jgi:hypothetical protein